MERTRCDISIRVRPNWRATRTRIRLLDFATFSSLAACLSAVS